MPRATERSRLASGRHGGIIEEMDQRHDPPLLELLEPTSRVEAAPDDVRTIEHASDIAVMRWLTPDRRPRPWPDDGSLRRVLPHDRPTSHAALVAYVDAIRPPSPAGHRPIEVAAPHSRLVLTGWSPDASSWLGAVHGRRRVHPIPVRLVLDDWSALRTELRLERTEPARRAHRGLARWYDAAHPILDVLRFEIGLRAATVS